MSKLTLEEARRIGKAISRIPEFMMQRQAPAEVATGRSLNKLGVLTSDSASLKRNGYFRQRAHPSGPGLVPLHDVYSDDSGNFTISIGGPGFTPPVYPKQARLLQTGHAPRVLQQ